MDKLILPHFQHWDEFHREQVLGILFLQSQPKREAVPMNAKLTLKTDRPVKKYF